MKFTNNLLIPKSVTEKEKKKKIQRAAIPIKLQDVLQPDLRWGHYVLYPVLSLHICLFSSSLYSKLSIPLRSD